LYCYLYGYTRRGPDAKNGSSVDRNSCDTVHGRSAIVGGWRGDDIVGLGDRKCSSAIGCRSDGTASTSVRFRSSRVKNCTPWVAERAVPRLAAVVSAQTRNYICRRRNCISTPVRCNASTTTSCAVTKIRVRVNPTLQRTVAYALSYTQTAFDDDAASLDIDVEYRIV